MNPIKRYQAFMKQTETLPEWQQGALGCLAALTTIPLAIIVTLILRLLHLAA